MADRNENTRVNGIEATLLIGVCLAAVYVAGWSYAYHWFECFGLGILPLEIPREFFLLYGYWTVKSYGWIILAAAIVAAFSSDSFWHVSIAPAINSVLRGIAPVLFLLVIMFAVAYELGAIRATKEFDRNMADGFNAFPVARVWLIQDIEKESPLSDVDKDLRNPIYRLFLQGRDHLYLFKPDGFSSPSLLAVPLSQIRSWRLSPRLPQ